MQHQCPRQAPANLTNLVPAQSEQRANQVAQVIPAGDARALLHGEHAILYQPRQKRRVDESPEAMDNQ